MRKNQGGTRKWCPKCKAVRVVKSSSPSCLGRDANQRVYRREYEDIHYFRRGQQCETCFHCWFSAEIDEDLIGELVRLRNALGDIKRTAEAASNESEYGRLRLLRLISGEATA